MNERQVAIITGASRGVGAATAQLLAGKNWNLILNCSRSVDQAEQVLQSVRDLGSEAVLVQCDIGQDAGCKALANAAQEQFGRIDGIVNNAGTTKFCALSDMDGLDDEDFLHIYRTNVIGPFQLIRAALPLLKQSDLKSVVNVASIAGLSGMGSSAAYSASKGALITLTKSLARGLGPVRINAVCPGFIQGDWLKQGLGEGYEQVKGQLEKATPLGLTSTAEQVAQGIYYLLAEAHVTTGETLLLDGGAHLAPTMRL
ncbi:MAG: SDR family NAD(P)-dependent oxidoreductase [Gammaproteobacteria bacterium]